MLIRKNTKAFKTILQLFQQVQHRENREKFIRVFITRAGNSVHERISTFSIPENGALYYKMTFATILTHLESSDRQLHVSDELPGLYFFHSSQNSAWDEFPFEFDEVLINEFSTLPELPLPRKKEKAEKFVLPTAITKSTGEPGKKEKTPSTVTKTIREKKEVAQPPAFGLKKKIQFTDLRRVVFREAKMNKQEVLNYYSQIAVYLLPYLKDRPQSVRISDIRAGSSVSLTTRSLFGNHADSIPEWIKTKELTIDKEKADWMLCNDKEHLMLCIEQGGIELHSFLSRTATLPYPDYSVISIDAPDSELSKAITVALALKEITDGLQLPSFIMTDGKSGLQVFLPLSPSTSFKKSSHIAKDICRLVRLKIPDLVAIHGLQVDTYGKVIMDYSLNEEGHGAITPYSLIAVDGAVVTIAAPLFWTEVNEDVKMEHFHPATIFERLKQSGDPFATLFKKKINSDELLERITKNYAFLF
jgi:DNA ligase D-like protein (predicted polymerase)